MNTSEILNKAADEIERRGWTTGVDGWNYSDDSSAPLCIEGGIQAVIGYDFGSDDNTVEFRTCPAYKAVAEYLDFHYGLCLYDWNDTAAQDQEHVVSVLRATAVIEEAKEKVLADA